MSALLTARGLCKSYRSGERLLPVLRDCEVALDAGASLAVVGPSGSGKSTLLAGLAGLEEPDAGSVQVDGEDLFAMRPGALAAFRGRRIGFVFQSYRLLPALSAEENVRVPLELAGAEDAAERARDWLERVGLAARRAHRPSRLSGGEQQRVALARALAVRPALILADEPTGNLDRDTGAAMCDLLFALCGEARAALLYVTHDEELARRADRARSMRDGRLADAG